MLDSVDAADEQRRWARRDPRREYVLLEGVGHAIHRERPDAVLDAVRRPLAGASGKPRGAAARST